MSAGVSHACLGYTADAPGALLQSPSGARSPPHDRQDLVQASAAGQRNHSAINYQFGDRAGLVSAIGAKQRVEAPPGLIETALVPLAASLTTESGRNYIIVLAEAVARLGTTELFQPGQAHTDSIQGLNRLLMTRLAGCEASRRLRIGQAILTVPVLLADIERDFNRGTLTITRGQRPVHTIGDVITAALTGATNPAQPSDEHP